MKWLRRKVQKQPFEIFVGIPVRSMAQKRKFELFPEGHRDDVRRFERGMHNRSRRTSGHRELCRREGIAQSLYYKWSKEFLEAGKQRLSGNTKRQADSEEVSGMKHENEQLIASRRFAGNCWWRNWR